MDTKLEEFSFTIRHKPGFKHGKADGLSRCEQYLPVSTAHFMEQSLLGLTKEEMKVVGPVLRAKESGQYPNTDILDKYTFKLRKLFQLWEQLVVQNGILVRCFESVTGTEPPAKQLVAPKCIHETILESLHAGPSGGHLGMNKTLGKLKARFYWPGHYRDTEYWCRTCSSCTTRKTPVPHNKGPLQSMVAGSPMQLVAVDLLGPFPTH
jgi:hypothetical protein